jgi:hypothetical protein
MRGGQRMRFVIPAIIGVVLTAFAVGKRNSLAWEVKKRSHLGRFDQHTHDSRTHGHEHAHVTHNRRQGPDQVWGEWEHLTAVHEHDHNHPQVAHAHLPHEDAEHEHLGEAHIHDHEHPTTSTPRQEF